MLTNLGSFSSGENTFTTPDNATLAGDTDYFVVFENTNRVSDDADKYSVKITNSTSEDSGKASG